MKVSLLRIYNDQRNPSMRLYADRLKMSLEAGFSDLVIEDFSPRGFSRPWTRRFWITDKLEDYFVRFCSYPQEIKNLKADIFHIVDHANAYLMQGLDINKVVLTCHDLVTLKLCKKEFLLGYEERVFSWPSLMAFMRSCGYLFKIRLLIVNSEETRREVARLLGYPKDKIRVVYPGIDPEFRKLEEQGEADPLRNSLSAGAKHILLHIGSKSNYKNFAGLLWAFDLLVKHYGRDISLIRVGEIAQRHQRLIKKLNLDKYIHILPQMPAHRLNLIYNLADVLVFPSLYEGFGWPTIEAMACGVPVVCSDKGGLKEAAGEAALIIDPYDAGNIASGVRRVIEDRVLRQQLISRGFQQVKKFTCAQMAGQVYQVYQELLSKN